MSDAWRYAGAIPQPGTITTNTANLRHDVPVRDGYDWLLNKCCDIDRAEHAGHLDAGEFLASCFHCQNGEGRS